MGIKFYCPQGHKLHVKTFLAGKKGVCPHCGTKVRIPLENQRDAAHDDGSPEPEESDISSESPLYTPVPVPATAPGPTATQRNPVSPLISPTPQVPLGVPGTMPVAKPATLNPAANVSPASIPAGRPAPLVPATVPVAAAGPSPAPLPAVTNAIPAALPTSPYAAGLRGVPSAVPTPTPLPTAPRTTMGVVQPGAPQGDPFAEAPNAEWYVCPPTGGRFGPANGEILKRWIGEGRVTADSLVWRSGWTDWKPASIVLSAWGVPGGSGSPGMGPPPTPGPAGQFVAAVPGISAGTTSSAAVSGYVARRKTSSTLGVVIVILLGILSIALLAALVWVIRAKT